MTNKKAIFACAALVAATAGGVATALPASASQGCGVTFDVHNKRSSDITVQWADSDSRAWLWPGVAGTWKKLDSGTTTVSPSAIKSHAVTLDLSCSTQHNYRLYINKGSGGTAYVYVNWTTNAHPHVDVT
jgi:hypothetical protein